MYSCLMCDGELVTSVDSDVMENVIFVDVMCEFD